MKRITAFLTALIVLLSLFSCNEKKEEAEIVDITIPAIEFSTLTQEQIMSDAEAQGHSACVINKDGSVTYTTTSASRKARLESDKAMVDYIISEITGSDLVGVSDIKYSEDMTRLDIYIDGEAFTIAEKLSPTMLLFPHMSSYQYFSLYNKAKISASFIDSVTNEVIDTASYNEYQSFFEDTQKGKKPSRNNFFSRATE